MRDLNSLSLEEGWSEICRTGLVRRLIELARDEDLGGAGLAGDITSAAAIPRGAVLRTSLNARASGVAAGLGCVAMAIDVFRADAQWTPRATDGARLRAGDSLGLLEGEARHVLAIERTVLNLVGRLCGVATLTAAFVECVRGSRASIYDTRKTTPGMRLLEKHAVRCGGGCAHRVGLYDAALLKDNHLAGVTLEALGDRVRETSAKARAGGARFVEVEVDTLEQLDRVLALEAGVVDVVLLDNFSPEALCEAVRRRDASGSRPAPDLEASGGRPAGDRAGHCAKRRGEDQRGRHHPLGRRARRRA